MRGIKGGLGAMLSALVGIFPVEGLPFAGFRRGGRSTDGSPGAGRRRRRAKIRRKMARASRKRNYR